MKMLNQNNLSENIQKFILKLNYKENNFLPVQTGSTDAGRELNMGFTCYALKILYTIDSNYLDDKDWMTKIFNSLEGYKKNYQDLPDYSYVDPAYYRIYKSSFYKLWIKNIIKFLLMRIKIHEVNPRFKFKEFIRAETKQTIATMTQVFPGYVSDFKDFPHEIKDLDKFFNNLNWNSPWNAGAQVAGICVFLSSLKNNSKQISYIDKYLQSNLLNDGSYGTQEVTNLSEKVNGAMKVITGLDWLNIPVHKPNELINLCLNHKPESEGCDLVDIVYVLYKCSLQTNYKEEEIKKYFSNLLNEIEEHYFEDLGGFSYYLNKSQTHYYGIKITDGIKEPDIHGTTLLVWSLSMIFEVLGDPYPKWNIIKP